MLDPREIRKLFGHIDVYVFDQLLRGNIAAGMRVFDAGHLLSIPGEPGVHL